MKEPEDPGGRVALYLELGADGGCMCHCLDHPGAAFKAVSPELVPLLAPEEIAAERAWLAGRGLLPPGTPVWPVAVYEAERVLTPARVREGDTEALFAPHRQPLDHATLEEWLRLLEATRAALLALADALPEELLDFRPAPARRSVREVLEHLADAEAFYLVRLDPPGPEDARRWQEAAAPGAPWRRRLAWVRRCLIERLGTLDGEARARTVVHDPHAEPWTARKVLYRVAWHERWHTRQPQRWLSS